MLCGAIWSAAPVSLRGLAPSLPPAPRLLAALVMHALHDDETSFLGTWSVGQKRSRHGMDVAGGYSG
ncbi:unnamed protein product [Colias eurytheme]|nr:unnamed protein product [Colias eurytheme]